MHAAVPPLAEVPMSFFTSGPLRIWLRGSPVPSKLGGVTLTYFLVSLAIRCRPSAMLHSLAW